MYRLLIVDPDSTSCQQLEQLLDWSSYGFTNILSAHSYSEALTTALDFRPHIALVDINLGRYRGYDLVSQLQKLGLSTIFCMISQSDDFRYIQKSLQVKARDYLLKPIHSKELSDFMNREFVSVFHGSSPCDSEPVITDPVLHVSSNNFSKCTRQILLAVQNDYQMPLTLTTIALENHMSSKYIGRLFIQDTGMKFNEYLTSYRMVQARHLIESTTEKISTIAYMVGYSQINNFYVHFKEYHKTSPSALRKTSPHR